MVNILWYPEYDRVMSSMIQQHKMITACKRISANGASWREVLLEHSRVGHLWALCEKYTVRSRYIAVIFLCIAHESHPIARP